MVGTHTDPGLMVLSFRTIFELIKKDVSKDTFEVSCSYLEVYNEVFPLFLLSDVLGFERVKHHKLRPMIIELYACLVYEVTSIDHDINF